MALRFVPDTIARFSPLPWSAGVVALVLLAGAQGLRWVAVAMVAVQLGRRGVPRWVAFGAGVYASTFVPAVFPWTPAGGVTPSTCSPRERWSAAFAWTWRASPARW